MRHLRLTIIVLAVALLAACAGNQRQTSLTTTLDAYAATLRWGNFKDAQGFIDPVYREAHPLTPLQLARYKQVKVAGYEPAGGPVPISDTEIKQTVKIGLVNQHTMGERHIIDHQTWQWDPKAKRWWLETGLPKITHPASQP